MPNIEMRTIQVLSNALDACSLRHEVISNNIANVNTPFFKRSYVSFEDEMIRAIRGEAELEAITTHPKHIKFGGVPDIAEVKPRIVVERDTIFRNDLNNVNLDKEMTDMHKNALHYSALCARISGKFRGLIDLIRMARP